MDRTSWCNKVDAVRLYASHRFALILPKGQICVGICVSVVRKTTFSIHQSACRVFNCIIYNLKYYMAGLHAVTLDFSYIGTQYFHGTFVISKENRIYIRGEFKESLGMNFFSPSQPEREFKVYKSCKCSQIICSRVH